MGLKMKYFVLKPEGNNLYASASRQALKAYSEAIAPADKILAEQLLFWATKEEESARLSEAKA